MPPYVCLLVFEHGTQNVTLLNKNVDEERHLEYWGVLFAHEGDCVSKPPAMPVSYSTFVRYGTVTGQFDVCNTGKCC